MSQILGLDLVVAAGIMVATLILNLNKSPLVFQTQMHTTVIFHVNMKLCQHSNPLLHNCVRLLKVIFLEKFSDSSL